MSSSDADSCVRFQDDITKARPDIETRTEQLVSRGIWMPPGYKVGDTGILDWFLRWLCSIALTGTLGEIWGSLGVIEQECTFAFVPCFAV